MTVPLITRLTPEALAALPEHRQAILRYLWPAWARPEQLPPPGDWVTWLIMTGRGWGKNRTAGEWIRQGVYDGVRLFALVGTAFQPGKRENDHRKPIYTPGPVTGLFSFRSTRRRAVLAVYPCAPSSWRRRTRRLA